MRSNIALSIIVAFLCVTAAAQPAPNKARVSGRVTSPTGETLRRAVVRLLGKETYKQTVDSDGAFSVDGVNPGSYVLIVQRTGYSAQEYGATTPLIRDCYNAEDTSIKPEDVTSLRQCASRAPGTALTLAAGTDLRDLTIKLTALGYISGRLTNQDGDPVPAWQVQPMQTVYVKGKRQLQAGRGGRTDADGFYSIGNLLPGKYVLRAYNMTGNMFAGLNGDRQGKPETEADRTTFYQGSAEASAATQVEVVPGAELTGMDIRLLRRRVYTIHGKVTVPPGTAVGDQILNISARAESGGIQNSIMALVHPDGTFEFRSMEPGNYVIRSAGSLTRPGIPTPDSFSGQMEVTVGSADVDTVMQVGTGASAIAVAGTITSQGTKPSTRPSILLSDPESMSGNPAAAPDSTGAFHFDRKFAPSRYIVNIFGFPAGFFVKSIRFGQQDALHSMLDLSSGGGASLDIVISSKVATIEGTVANAAGVVVVAWPRISITAADGSLKSASTDQDGHFEIGDLGPGDYLVAAFEDLDPGLLRDADFLSRFSARATKFSLEEGGRATGDVKVIPRQQVAAEVAKLQ